MYHVQHIFNNKKKNIYKMRVLTHRNLITKFPEDYVFFRFISYEKYNKHKVMTGISPLFKFYFHLIILKKENYLLY